MTRGIPIDPKLKSEILDQIKNQGMSVYQASRTFGVGYETIRQWVKGEMSGGERNLLRENNRLKKELDNAYRVIGKLAADSSFPKD